MQCVYCEVRTIWKNVPVSHRGGVASVLSQSMCDLWWQRCTGTGFWSILSISFHQCSILIFVLPERQTSEDWEPSQSNAVSETGARWVAEYLFTCGQGWRRLFVMICVRRCRVGASQRKISVGQSSIGTGFCLYFCFSTSVSFYHCYTLSTSYCLCSLLYVTSRKFVRITVIPHHPSSVWKPRHVEFRKCSSYSWNTFTKWSTMITPEKVRNVDAHHWLPPKLQSEGCNRMRGALWADFRNSWRHRRPQRHACWADLCSVQDCIAYPIIPSIQLTPSILVTLRLLTILRLGFELIFFSASYLRFRQYYYSFHTTSTFHTRNLEVTHHLKVRVWAIFFSAS